MKLLKEIYANANSLESFVQGMSDFFAELSKSKIIPNYHNPLFQSYSTEIANILIGTSLSRLTILWQIFSNGVRKKSRQSHNELSCTEMLVIKAIYSCNLPTPEEIMDAEVNYVPDCREGNQNTEKSLKLSNPNLKEKFEDIKKTSPTKQTNNDNLQIFDFLKFCHKNKEMDIYYLLLNEVEIDSFASNKMEIAGKIASNMQNKLERITPRVVFF